VRNSEFSARVDDDHRSLASVETQAPPPRRQANAKDIRNKPSTIFIPTNVSSSFILKRPYQYSPTLSAHRGLPTAQGGS
jgi:hypothetical protein